MIIKGQKPWRKFRGPVMKPGAVEAFLNRKILANHDHLKQLKEHELLGMINASAEPLPPFKFLTSPRQCQQVCLAISTYRLAFLFFVSMGGGKCKLILDMIRFRKHIGQLSCALICVPEKIHFAAWEDQIKLHAPDLRIVFLSGDKQNRMKQFEKVQHGECDAAITIYAGLQVFMTSMQPVKTKEGRPTITKTGKVKEKHAVDVKLSNQFVEPFNFVAFDECHHLGNHQSLVSQLAGWISSKCEFKYAFAGMPFGRDPIMMWPQFKIIDGGETLGASIGLFRAAFFNAKKDEWASRKMGWDIIKYEFDQEKWPKLHRLLKHRSIFFAEDELGDLPELNLIPKPVELSPEGKAHYKKILAGFKEAKGNYESMKNSFIRMRQVASGFLSLKAEDESQIKIRIKENPKLEMLQQLLLDREPNSKVLIFHEFTYSGNVIRELLDELKIGHASMWSGVKDATAEYHRFMRDPKCQAFVLNNSLGTESINPQTVCNQAIVYESPISVITRKQLEKRLHRQGQTKPIFIYDIVARGTIEEKILTFQADGKDLFKAVMEGAEII